jgi:hypothetical protein
MAYLIKVVVKVLFKRQPLPTKQMGPLLRGQELSLALVVHAGTHLVAPEIVGMLVGHVVARHVVVVVHEEAEAAL